MDATDDENNGTVSEKEEFALRVSQLMSQEKHHDSPINLNIGSMITIILPKLTWHNYEIPCKKMKLTNSGNTVILSAKWYQERPFLTGGPFTGNYVFSQLHFHWGKTDMEGSEHTADGAQYPVEMHVVHFKSCYLTQEAALREKDGLVVTVYLFKLQGTDNPNIQTIMNSIPDIQTPQKSVRMQSCHLGYFLKPFTEDYFMYWGSIPTSTYNHIILWLVAREPIGISSEQVEIFRTIYDLNDEPLDRNFRNVQTVARKVYHVNPSKNLYATLLPIAKESFKTNKEHVRRTKITDK